MAAPKKDAKAKAKPVKKVKKAAAAKPSAEFKTLKFKDHTISKKRSGRFEVVTTKGKNVNGLDKAKILVEANLVKTGLSKAPAKEEAPAAPSA